MAQWQRTLDVKDVWDSKDIPLIARTAADRLAQLAPFPEGRWPGIEEAKLDLIDELRDLAGNETAHALDFDYVWSDVYDWADTSLDGKWNGMKVCWIKTF